MSTPIATKPLYHFTCSDGHRMIGKYNCLLIPQPRCWPVVWLTDQAEPEFESIGLDDPVLLSCDRRAFRYVVTDVSSCRPWLGSPERAELWATDRPLLTSIELPGLAQPEHWWISSEPVRADWDRSWQWRRAS